MTIVRDNNMQRPVSSSNHTKGWRSGCWDHIIVSQHITISQNNASNTLKKARVRPTKHIYISVILVRVSFERIPVDHPSERNAFPEPLLVLCASNTFWIREIIYDTKTPQIISHKTHYITNHISNLLHRDFNPGFSINCGAERTETIYSPPVPFADDINAINQKTHHKSHNKHTTYLSITSACSSVIGAEISICWSA